MADLPFLKKSKQMAGLIIEHRKPDGNIEEDHEDTGNDDALRAAMQDLMRAIKQGDEEHACNAFRAAFQILESEPHDEAEHDESPSPHTYDAQNQKAGE